MKLLLFIASVLISMGALAQTKVAVVKLIRGEANVLTLGKTTPLKANDWVENGSVVKTEEKSFVKLIFVDKSQMNVGPNSEMKIESFSGKDAGVIDLVKGKIRSQVTKDYLQIQDKDKSKLFIKTQNAVMGVRGTDFMISTNGINTSTVLFEGEVVFNKLEAKSELSTGQLEDIVNRGVRMFPGEFSVMEASRPQPTVPSLLNIQQREQLEKNSEFDSNRSPSSASAEVTKSVVPEGLNGQQVSNSADIIKSEVAQISTDITVSPPTSRASSDPDGFVKGDLVKPANGSFVHVESGVIIPPGPGSVLDGNTNTYIPGQDSGKVAHDGSYIPPKNVEITNDGKLLIHDGDKVVEKKLPPPVKMPDIFKADSQKGDDIVSAPRPRDIPLPEVGLDSRFSPTGGQVGNDPARVLSGGSSTVDTRIIVKPQ